ncbi:helix-turn-helix domain-containing protein [Pseudomonas sp. F(2018)]|uniref:helix-turn-helix domain-containing protein n=1 Tax=Pseudomonas sp. F(2018) TaxID=2502240 RepID=UPI0010F7D92A|nr:helix-turn-helix domain-containing protein [Pseudomonas sp. F(2018)]
MDVIDIPADLEQRWEWIKYQLRINDCSTAELARQLSVTDRAIRNAKLRPYPRIERAIAQALGIDPWRLWPERWNADGTPHRQRPNRAESLYSSTKTELRKHNAACPVGHRKKAMEA